MKDDSIPSSWKWEKLGDDRIGFTASGGTPDRDNPDYYGGAVKWVKSGELNDGSIYDTEEKLTELGLRNSSAKIFPSGTLLIAMYGATAGKTAILGVEAATNQAICAITPKNNAFDSRFLQYWLIKARNSILESRSGGAQPNVNQRIIGSLRIPLPPLPEQRAIAAILRTVQNAIDARRHETKLERERKAALMAHLFHYGTRGEALHDTPLGKLPQSWRVGKLGDFLTLQRGFDLPDKQRKAGVVPIVASAGIVAFHNEAKVEPPGVVTGRYGTIGKVFYIEEDFWPLNTTLFVSDFKGNDPLCISYFLQTMNLSSLNDKTSVPGVNRNHAHIIPASLPSSLEEQQEIAAILRACDDKLMALNAEISRLKELFRALLEELMNGRLSTREIAESGAISYNVGNL